METLNKITKESFYCYRGFIIRLYKSGTFALYDTHTMGSLSANTEQDRLSACMEKIDKICKERYDKEQELNKFAKFIKPYIDTISNEVLQNVKNLKG